MKQIETKNYKRIHGNTARMLHKDTDTVVFCLPCNMNPENVWMHPSPIDKEEDFKKFVNHYSFYNCNSETGQTVAFYIKKPE